jgi:hypothetical protein
MTGCPWEILAIPKMPLAQRCGVVHGLADEWHVLGGIEAFV